MVHPYAGHCLRVRRLHVYPVSVPVSTQCANHFYRKYKLHRKVIAEPLEKPMPTVSILKPLMGVDPNLEQNLETFFTMNYPAVRHHTSNLKPVYLY